MFVFRIDKHTFFYYNEHIFERTNVHIAQLLFYHKSRGEFYMSTNAKKRKSLRERRKIQRRKLQIRAAAALLSLVAVTFLLIFHFTPQNTQADSEPKAPTYKYYTSIRVSSGDTLWDIAKEYRTEEYSDISSYIAEVREINHLSSNQITDGMYLCIPYYSEEYKS